MRVICSACGVDLTDSLAAHTEDDMVSHGLCELCYKQFVAQVGMPLEEYLEGIPAPTVTVTPEGTVNTANQAACLLLDKSVSEFQGFKGGDVFACENARLPEGCGETIHCGGCTIRNTVMDTMQTGKPHRRTPAYLNPETDFLERRMDLLISTEKKGGVVFLIIEEMKPANPTERNHR